MRHTLLIIFVLLTSSCCTTKNQTLSLVEDRGTFEVEVTINSVVKLPFLVDTGASSCSMPSYVVMTLIKAGTIKRHHILSNQTYTLADGRNVECRRVLVDHIKIGNRVLYNVIFSVSDSSTSPVLLGGGALKKLGKVSIDYDKKELEIHR